MTLPAFATRSTKSQRFPAAGGRSRIQTLYTIAAASLAAIVPLIVLAGIWMRSELAKNQRESEAFLTTQARSISDRLDGEIRYQLSALSTLATMPSLDGPDLDALGAEIDRIRAARPEWSVIGLLDADTAEHILSRGGEWPAENEREVVANVRQSRSPSVETRVVDPSGTIEVLLYVPVIRADAVRSILVAAVHVQELGDVSSQPSRNGILVTVLDRQNRVLSRSHGTERIVGSAAAASFSRGIAERPEGVHEWTAHDGEPLFGAFSRSPLTGWLTSVAINRKQLDANSHRAIWATVGAGALSVALIAILAVFLFHTVVERRLSNERLAASQALGELDARLLTTTQEALDEQRKAASEREVLLREIYHRVKNNLQIVQSLLRLGSRELRPDQREPFESAVRRIGAMARVHTLLYNSPDLASIDFKDYLEELLRELSEGFAAEERSIEHVLDARSLRLPLDTAVPLAFIAVEILTNAFRHAFPEGRAGRISVEARREDSVGILRIEDNGIGLTAKQKSNRRLGLTIVAKLVQQIGGTLQEPEPGSSTFVITFPLEQESAPAPSADRRETVPAS